MEECGTKAREYFVSYFTECNPVFIDELYKLYGPYNPKNSVACCYMKCLVAVTCWNEDAIRDAYTYVKRTHSMLVKLQDEHNQHGTTVENILLKVLTAETWMLTAVMKIAIKRCLKHYLKAGYRFRNSWKIYSSLQSRISDICDKVGITKLGDVTAVNYTPPIQQPLSNNEEEEEEEEDEEDQEFISTFDMVEDIQTFLNDRESCLEAINEIKELKVISQFGYGLFHLILSLIPPTALKIVNMFGIFGDRYVGISSLWAVTRHSTCFRALLSSSVLLWYYLSLRPTFVFSPQHIQSGIRLSDSIMKDMLGPQFEGSWITLYFSGLINKIQGNSDIALEQFQHSAVKSAHLRECKLLAYYEIGWCHLVNWNWSQASEIYTDLMTEARWSKAFYGYLAAISMGSGEGSQAACRALLNEVPSKIKNSVNVDLNSYCIRKSNLISKSKNLHYYCTIASLEILYIWQNLRLTEPQADSIIDLVNNRPTDLPPCLLSSSYLLVGLAWAKLQQLQRAEQALKISDTIIQPDAHDNYISVSTAVELSRLYLRLGQEGKSVEYAEKATSKYRGYDLESKLYNRVNNISY